MIQENSINAFLNHFGTKDIKLTLAQLLKVAMTESDKWEEQIMEVMSAYVDIVEKGLDQRWKCMKVELYEAEPYEVIGAILARQA